MVLLEAAWLSHQTVTLQSMILKVINKIELCYATTCATNAPCASAGNSGKKPEGGPPGAPRSRLPHRSSWPDYYFTSRSAMSRPSAFASRSMPSIDTLRSARSTDPM